jgi:hypothetical protein
MGLVIGYWLLVIGDWFIGGVAFIVAWGFGQNQG